MTNVRSRSGEVLRGVDRAAAAIVLVATLVPPLLLLAIRPAQALDAERGVASVFFIAKSENRNQIHYGVRLDPQCRPVGRNPVHAYWRDLEEGPAVTSPLLAREQPAYGIGVQYARVTELGGNVRVRLRAYPSRVLVIETSRGPSGCVARAVTTISGRRAHLVRIFAQIGFLSVDHIVLHGRSLDGDRPVQERLGM